MKMISRINAFICLLLLLSVNILCAQAGISVSPPRTYFTLNEGDVERKKIIVTNTSSENALELAISFNDWIYDEFGSNQVSEPNSLSNSCASWLTVFPSNVISLAPKETKEIEVQMTVPQQLTPEFVHTAMMYITQTNVTTEQNKKGENIRITLRTGVKIYHRKNVGRDLNVDFSDFSYSKEKNQLVLKIENIGNVWGEGTIKNEIINQETGEEISLKEMVFYSLPGDKRTIHIDLPENLAKSKYIVNSTLNLGDTDFIKIAELSFSNE